MPQSAQLIWGLPSGGLGLQSNVYGSLAGPCDAGRALLRDERSAMIERSW